MLIAKGANVNARDKRGDTPLHLADNADIATMLIAKGANVNAKGYRDRTPLHRNVYKPEVVKVLIAKGADVNVRDTRGDTPLHNAAFGGYDPGPTETIMILMAAGADVNARNKNDLTPLDMALSNDDGSPGHRKNARIIAEGGGIEVEGERRRQIEARNAEMDRIEEQQRIDAIHELGQQLLNAANSIAVSSPNSIAPTTPNTAATTTAKQRVQEPASSLHAYAVAEQDLSLTRDQRAMVQNALNILGHDNGKADGIFGPRTRIAIKALQKALGLDPNGYLDAGLLDQLANVQEETQLVGGTIPLPRTCLTERKVGVDDRYSDGSVADNYSVDVEFTNNCAHKVFVTWRHLSGLKADYDRGKPIRCSTDFGTDLDPGESYVTQMGPLMTGIEQRWSWCSQYADEDVHKRTGHLNCTQSKQPTCPPIP